MRNNGKVRGLVWKDLAEGTEMAQPDRRRENPALLEDERRRPNAAETGIGADPSDARPSGDRSNVNDAGSDATDTPDGPTQTEETVRQPAEPI